MMNTKETGEGSFVKNKEPRNTARLIALSVHTVLEEVEGRLHSIHVFADDNHLLEVSQTGGVLSRGLSLSLHLVTLLGLFIKLERGRQPSRHNRKYHDSNRSP